MLIRFSIENFLSFSERTGFSMIPGKSRNQKHHIIQSEVNRGIPVLKSAIIYGANASGKTNIAKAIQFARRFILRGTQSETDSINYMNFRLDKEYAHKPARVEFEIKHRGKNYAYGFLFTHNLIIEEWLYEINKEYDKKVFERNINKLGKTEFDLHNIKLSSKTEFDFLSFTAAGTRKNQLFLTECKVRNVKDNVSNFEDIFNVYDWFQNALKVIFPKTKYQQGLEFEIKENKDLSKVFHEFLAYFNTGITGVDFREIDFDQVSDIPDEVKRKIVSETTEVSKVFISDPDKNLTYTVVKGSDGVVKCFKMMAKHQVKGSQESELFEIAEESDGTQRIMDFIPAIMDLFQDGNVFVIDEIDRSLHPNLTYDLIDLFLSESKNIKSQLIVTTHESSLLSQKLVRKDEIWFVVKDKYGASSIYSLEEFKVRFDKEIRRDYLLGRFKAIPVFGRRSDLTVLSPN